MVVINSALWDAMAWAMAHARKGWEECAPGALCPTPSRLPACCVPSPDQLSGRCPPRGDFNVPAGLSSRMRRKNIHQVFEPG